MDYWELNAPFSYNCKNQVACGHRWRYRALQKLEKYDFPVYLLPEDPAGIGETIGREYQTLKSENQRLREQNEALESENRDFQSVITNLQARLDGINNRH